MKILFVIPTLFNDPNIVKECVDSINSSMPDSNDHTITVVCNTANDEFEKWTPPANVIKECSNVKYNISRAINVGISKRTTEEYICYVDHGTRFQEGWLAPILKLYQQHDNIGVIGNRKHSTFRYYHNRLSENAWDVLWTDGIMFMTYDTFKLVGEFDESYFADCETQDFCYKLIEHHNRMNIAIDSEYLSHAYSPNLNTDRRELFNVQESSRNLFMSRWDEWRRNRYNQ